MARAAQLSDPPRARPSDARDRGLRAVVSAPAFKAAGVIVMVGLVVLYAGSLVLRNRTGYSELWDGWVGNLVLIPPTMACFLRAFIGGPRRAAAMWLGIGLASFTFGNVVYVGWIQFDRNAPDLNASVIGYLGIYPAFAAAVACLVRRDGGRIPRAVWLDAALGAAGAATALAAAMNPVLRGIEGDLGQVLAASASPIGDLVLIAMICGLIAIRGLRAGPLWIWLAGGLVIFCAADVIYALRVASNTYVPGSVLDALWVVALVVIALAVWRPARPPAADAGRTTAVLAVPLAGTITGVIVLIYCSFHQMSPVVVGLAALTLGLAVARTIVGFRQVQRLSDARRQALTDDLTGLGNRRWLFEAGTLLLRQAGASGRTALMLIDLDDFKEVNDALGHQAGDRLLHEIARRLASRVSAPDLLVRLGGDEFALVIALPDAGDGRHIAEAILERLSQPHFVSGTALRTEASIGIARATDDADTIAELLRQADVAMYAAKTNRSRVALYDAQLDEQNHSRLAMMRELKTAIARREFVLHYQPKLDVHTGAVVGAEALVRWAHPVHGLVYPDAFLRAVEQGGMMSALTEAVLETAIDQLATWRSSGLEITIAVNLSASDLLDVELAPRIDELLTSRGVPGAALGLEITESVLMTDPDRALGVLGALRGLGLRIAVDDYGTGYSSLSYLSDLPVDELKIDRSFVARMTEDPRRAAIVRSTIDLAHALELTVVAEGVEQVADLALLTSFGCDIAQGYHFSPPVSAEAFAGWVAVRSAVPPPSARAAA
jgi:diguanylate cyclase (GGDEF)-like protein